MDYDKLMQSAPLRDVVQRVREVGLHKVAADLHGVPEFNIKTAVAVLGQRLLLNQARYEKIASGIRALNALDEGGDVKLAEFKPLKELKVETPDIPKAPGMDPNKPLPFGGPTLKTK